jgi:hypothetical protein
MKNKAAVRLRAIKSAKRSAASRANGKLGGRPRKMSTRDIVRELYNIKSQIELDTYTMDNIDALIAKLV